MNDSDMDFLDDDGNDDGDDHNSLSLYHANRRTPSPIPLYRGNVRGYEADQSDFFSSPVCTFILDIFLLLNQFSKIYFIFL